MTYDEIVEAIRQWLMDREDLTVQIPQFIRMAEAKFDRVLRTKEMIVRSKATISDQYLPLPDDWIKAKNVQISGEWPLALVTMEELDKYRHDLNSHRINAPYPPGPRKYAIVGESIELAPSPSATAPVEIEMAYYANIPRLSNSNQENWLSKYNPDAYIYGALVHSAPYLQEDERTDMWQNARDTVLSEINTKEAEARMSGSSMVLPTPNMGW